MYLFRPLLGHFVSIYVSCLSLASFLVSCIWKEAVLCSICFSSVLCYTLLKTIVLGIFFFFCVRNSESFLIELWRGSVDVSAQHVCHLLRDGTYLIYEIFVWNFILITRVKILPILWVIYRSKVSVFSKEGELR